MKVIGSGNVIVTSSKASHKVVLSLTVTVKVPAANPVKVTVFPDCVNATSGTTSTEKPPTVDTPVTVNRAEPLFVVPLAGL
ncbi:MAG: hypothetical protein PHF81_11860, partial [Flavobacterium sp.]|nr:hypothetical protein [Flavobacterium sp.]